MLQQYVPRLTDRGLEAVEGGVAPLAPLTQVAKIGRAAYVASWGWFQGPAIVLGSWVSGLGTTFIRPSKAGAPGRSLCDVWLRPHPPILSLAESASRVGRWFRAAFLKGPRYPAYTKGVGGRGLWDRGLVFYASDFTACIFSAWDLLLRRAAARWGRKGGRPPLSSWLWGFFWQDPRFTPWVSPRPLGKVGRVVWARLGERREVGLAAVRGGLTRGLTRAVAWSRVVVLNDPLALMDTCSRPTSPYVRPARRARTRALWFVAPVELPLGRSRGRIWWDILIRDAKRFFEPIQHKWDALSWVLFGRVARNTTSRPHTHTYHLNATNRLHN